MLTGHNYIVFLSGKYRGCDFPGHVLPPRNHHKPVCWYSMRRSWIPASLSCVPDVHNTSGYLFFSTGAVSVFSFPISSPASPDTRTRSHLHGFLPHILQSHLQSFYPVLCSDVSYMPIFPVSAQSHVPSGFVFPFRAFTIHDITVEDRHGVVFIYKLWFPALSVGLFP